MQLQAPLLLALAILVSERPHVGACTQPYLYDAKEGTLFVHADCSSMFVLA